MQYEIYHDENREDGYNHGLLFIPLETKNRIIELLTRIRDEYSYDYDQNLKFAGVFTQTGKQQYINNVLALFSQIVKSRHNQSTDIFKYTQREIFERSCEPYLVLQEDFKCKFGFLKVPNNHSDLNDTLSYPEKVETTFRFILKSGCHGMFSEQNPIEIKKFYFDGNEHHGGDIDINRITNGAFRSYVSISDDVEVCCKHWEERSNDEKILMNFIDNIVGAWSSIVNNGASQAPFLFPLSDIHERAKQGLIFSNPNSRWFKTLSFCKVTLENEEFDFPDLFLPPQQDTLF